MPSTQSISSSVARRASRSPRPADAASSTTTAGSGHISPVSFAHYDPTSSSWKPRQGCFRLGEMTGDSGLHRSRRSLVTWPRSGSMRSGHAFERPRSVPRTSAAGSSSWPTPAGFGTDGHGSELGMAAKRTWPTPKASNGTKAGRPRRNDRGDLQAVVLWPTPSASNPNERESLASWQARRERELSKGRNGNGMGMPLGIAVKLWPTPRAQEGGPDYAKQARGQADPRGSTSPSLATAVTLWPTPMARDHHGERTTRQQTRGRQLPDVARSCLNPDWVEALMGLPQGWTAIAGRRRPARRTPGSRRARSRRAASPTAPPG